MILDINAWEAVIIVVLAFVVIGPDRLPEYAAKLGRGVRQLKALAEGARAQLREQVGPDFDDIDWAAYDPRQYDPRRIVREALADPTPLAEEPGDGHDGSSDESSESADDMHSVPGSSGAYDPRRATPYDPDAT